MNTTGRVKDAEIEAELNIDIEKKRDGNRQRGRLIYS